MKTIVTSIIFLLSIHLIGQSNSPYYKKMQTNLKKFQTCKTPLDYSKIALKFEQISLENKKEWLPLYYTSLSYILANFAEPNSNTLQKDSYLKLASIPLNKILTSNPSESEIYALECLFLTAKLIVNPEKRAKKYTPLITLSYTKSLIFNSKNPRAKYLKLANELGVASYFGNETSTICSDAKKLLLSWEEYKTPNSIYPKWGKNKVKEIIANCSTKNDTTHNNISDSASLNILITNIKSNKGNIHLQISNEKGELIQKHKLSVTNKKAELNCTLASKKSYSIKYYHDENSNEQLDKAEYGRPTEGYGFSNNVKGNFGPPKFPKTLFSFTKNTELTLITIN